MKDGWKILRGEKAAPEKDAPSATGGIGDIWAGRGEEPARGAGNSGAGSESGDAAANRYERPADRYGDVTDSSPKTGESGSGTSDDSRPPALATLPSGGAEIPERSNSRKSFVVALCVLVFVVMGWVFRDEVRGVVSWAAARAQGRDVPLSSKAPGLGNLLRFGKSYTLEEFFAVCAEGKAESAAKILEKQPELLEPKNGTTILHMALERSINPEIFGLLLKRVGKAGINAKDSRGKTPLHLVAESGVPAGYALALRGSGADIFARDNDGKTPVDAFFASALSKPGKISTDERNMFGQYGHYETNPLDRAKNGKPRRRFIPLVTQVPNTEGKRYFTQLAHALAVAHAAGAGSEVMASGDAVGPRPRKLTTFERTQAKMYGSQRDPLPPLWKSVAVKPDTGAALVRLKCLLPEAYPSTLNYFSARMAEQKALPVYNTEWNAWDVPDDVKAEILRQYLLTRVRQSRPQQNSFTFDGAGDGTGYTRNMGRFLRERGDNPFARNPLLMTWVLLEYGQEPSAQEPPAPEQSAPEQSAQEKPALIEELTVPARRTEGKDAYAGKELANLRALHSLLPEDVWRRVGQHLVAAAYVADKRRDVRWGAGFMPQAYQKKGGLGYLRLWGCEDMNDLSEPLRRVLAETGNVSPDVARGMVALVLRSGPQSAARDTKGRTPVEYAKGMDVPAGILALLEKTPVYEPAAPKTDSSAPVSGLAKDARGPAPSTRKAPPISPESPGRRQPLGRIKSSAH